MLVKDVYLDCFRFEESTLAHYIYHLLAEKKITLGDNISKLDLKQADHQKAAEIIQQNVLGIYKSGIYSLKMNRTVFVFIYACSQEEAIRFYTQTFRKRPLNCREYPLEFQLARGNGVISFRDMKKEFKSFPAIAGYFMKRSGGQKNQEIGAIGPKSRMKEWNYKK
ncbi:hypothetical protein [Neobacillus mesonae]|uniref:hypothetical protein n=1 Tax=Neobacillus mesonae TaxID=1193713 RepID=UPI00203F2FE5|nr:hypothetical protein [Neobacillus mesonae]MCM3569319.1 hypothetical protein [Neobacillus mesonae]